MVAGRREEITSVGGINIEEYSRNDDGLFLEEFLEEGLMVPKSQHYVMYDMTDWMLVPNRYSKVQEERRGRARCRKWQLEGF